MNTKPVTATKDQFVALLREAGISDTQMQTLHRLFEQRHPDAHDAFLRHLQIPDAEVNEIRQKSR